MYLATVLDCFSKKVVGYAMAEHMRTELVVDALRMAVENISNAREDIGRYIELRFIQIRLHSALGYRTPNEVESDWLEQNQAA